jgi:hypothetical protein
MGLQRFPLSDYRGGLNTKDGPFGLEPNEAQSLLNVVLSTRGVLSQREGKSRLDVLGGHPSGARTDHMRPWYNPTAKFLILSAAGSIYSLSGNLITLRQTGAGGSVWSFEQGTNVSNLDFLWAMNGVDAPVRWDGLTGTFSAWANTPPNGTMLRLWKNRMCIAGQAANPQRLFFSDIGNPESPAATYGTNWIDIKSTEDDRDPITWLEVVGDYLLVFKRNSVWRVHDSNTFANTRLGNPGCEGRFQSAVVGNRCYFFSRAGIWSTTGSEAPAYESDKIENFLQDNLNYSALSRVRLCGFRHQKLYIAVPFGTTDQNSRLLEFIPKLQDLTDATAPTGGAWLVHDYACASLANFRPLSEDFIACGASDAEKLFRLFDGRNDDGSAINAHWWSSWRPLLAEEPFERIRRVNVEMNGRLKLEVLRDFEASPNFIKVLETGDDEDPTWDGDGPEDTWDNGGLWSAVELTQLRRARPESRGRYHSVRVSNDVLDKIFTVYAMEFALRGGKEH